MKARTQQVVGVLWVLAISAVTSIIAVQGRQPYWPVSVITTIIAIAVALWVIVQKPR